MIIKISLVLYLHWCHSQPSIIESPSHRWKALRQKPLSYHSRNHSQITARTNLLPQLAENTYSEHHHLSLVVEKETAKRMRGPLPRCSCSQSKVAGLVKTATFLDGSSASATLRISPPEILLQHSTQSLRTTILPSRSSLPCSLCAAASKIPLAPPPRFSFHLHFSFLLWHNFQDSASRSISSKQAGTFKNWQ